MTAQHSSDANYPLAGRTVVITRPREDNELVTELESYGARVLPCPTIEIAEPESYERLDEALNHLYGYDWLVFTNVHSVEYFLRRFKAKGFELSTLDDLRVCAIGEATETLLRDEHVHVDVVPRENKADGILETLAQFVGGREGLSGLNFLLPRAAVTRDFLPRALADAGARVDVVPTYRAKLPANIDRGRITAMLAGGADCIAFTSPSSVRNLAQLFDTMDLIEVFAGVVVACLGDVTAATAFEHGLHSEVVSEQSTVPALARAIADHFRHDPRSHTK